MTDLRKGFFIAAIVLVFYIWIFVSAEYTAAGEITRDDRFIAYADGTVLDTKTNLMWAAKDNGSGINWADAKTYCENYRGGGHKDWRMPLRDELAGLYASGAHKDKVLITGWVWASEISGSYAVGFDFNGGGKSLTHQSGDASTRALPVRSAR
jgi:hypothetical protein